MKTDEHLINELIDGKYRIVKLLGKGGMGAVYLATHIGTDRPVALKVIAPQFMLHDEFVARFQREARAAGRLRHPNVVNVTDFGFAQVQSARVAYLVMEYLDGCTLNEVLAEETQLPLGWVVDIMDQVCSAVHEAHQQGIIHRDLKPDNIWLEPNRRGGYTVKVLDFGLAKLSDGGEALVSSGPLSKISTTITGDYSTNISAPRFSSLAGSPPPASEKMSDFSETTTQILPTAQAGAAIGAEEDQTLILPTERTVPDHSLPFTAPADGLTRVGSVMGTPPYMSPEQCRSQPLDFRSDIYSLGVIAWQMLAGQTPFTGDHLAVMRQHIEASPPSLKERRKGIPRRVAEEVMTALAKAPADRPASAAAFATALRANSEGTGDLVRRSFMLYSQHFPKFIRISLLVNLPLVIISALGLLNGSLKVFMVLPSEATSIAGGIFKLLLFLGTLTTGPVIYATATRLVAQLQAAPLRRIAIRPAFAALNKVLRPFIVTNLLVVIITFAGLLLCVFPAIYFLITFSLWSSVVMMEGKFGRAALRRSKELVKRSKSTAALVAIIQFILPILSAGIFTTLVTHLTEKINSDGIINVNGMPIALGQAARLGEFSELISELVTNTVNIFTLPFGAILCSLLYLKTRQAGGETLKEMLRTIEDEDLPRSAWQRRMRERLQLSGGATRHTPSGK